MKIAPYMEINMTPKKADEGILFEMNDGSFVKVLKYINAKNILVRFIDNKTDEFWAHIGNLRKGKYKNPFTPSVFNHGFIGVGNYNPLIHKDAKYCWIYMLERCFTNKRAVQVNNTIDEKWLNFQNFSQWYYCQENWSVNIKLELDKDVKILGNRHYGPDTCCLLPREINTIYPKSYTTGGRVYYYESDNTWKVWHHDIKGKRISKSFKSKIEAEKWKELKTINKFSELADKYKDCLTEEIYLILKERKNVYLK